MKMGSGKDITGKPRLSLVPPGIIEAVDEESEGMSEQRKRTTVTEEMKQEMQEMRNDGMTIAQVAEKMGLSYPTVCRWTVSKKKWEAAKGEEQGEQEEHEEQDTPDKPTRSTSLRSLPHDEKIARMQELRDAGVAMDRIAKRADVSIGFVAKNTTRKFAKDPLPEPKGCALPESLRERVPINGRGLDNEQGRTIERVTVRQGSESSLPKSYYGKDTDGKIRMSLVPPGIIEAVGEVRTFGCKKYGAPDNWKTVKAEFYVDALMRHLVRYLRDPKAVDEESGLSHLAHMACNIAFLIEMESTTCGTNDK